MNTTGWVRGYISHNSPIDKFIRFVINTIGQEFGEKTKVQLIDDIYTINIGQYRIEISIDDAEALQKTGPYALDRCFLNSLKDQGLRFQFDRSQYTRYCYGLIDNETKGERGHGK